jgi:effector-binding domain-containing protein
MKDGEMNFVMPEKHRTAAPKPASQQVEVKTLPARRVAVYRYSGRSTRANEMKALQKIKAWLEGNEIQHGSDHVVAYYDPPWTLPPLRRNEVMLPVN